jgi:hypothetical protein
LDLLVSETLVLLPQWVAMVVIVFSAVLELLLVLVVVVL